MPSPGFNNPDIPTWAKQMQGKLQSQLGLGVDYRILGAGEAGEFARFQISSGYEHLIMDLTPGPITEFGRTFEMVYQGGSQYGEFSGARFGPELIAMPGKEEPGKKPTPVISLRSPFEAMTEYFKEVFTSPTLKQRFPQDPQRRLGKLLYKGIEEGAVAGALQQSAMFHTGLSRELQARSVAVAIHPDLKDQRAVHEAIYRFATQAAIADPTSPAAALQYYVPHKETGDIVRLHPLGLGFAGWGGRGEYDPTYWGATTEQITALEESKRHVKAAETMYKRQTITYGMMGVRERASLFGVNAAGQMAQVEPEFITGAKASAGWKWLNALAPGQTERMAAYVRPGVVFTPGSPVSGAGFLYGPEGFQEGAALAGIPKEHRVALPPLGVPEIPTMGLDFGIFRRKEIPATEGTEKRIEYTREAELPGYALGVGESAIIGLMKYRAKTGEEIIQEIAYTSGTSPTVFTGLPTLRLPPQYNVATGEGMAGFAKNIGQPTLPFAAAAEEKFGIPVEVRTQSKYFLDFPLLMGTAASGKGFGVKTAWQELETLTKGWKQPTVDIAGRQALVTGMTGEIKERISHFTGVFFGMSPEQQLAAVGEFGTAPGATKQAKAMSDVMQRHIKTVNLNYFAGQGDPGAVSTDLLGQIYASYTGSPSSSSNPYHMMNEMRGIIERPGYEGEAVEKYGHALVRKPNWYAVGLGGRDQWKVFRQAALEGAELLLQEEGLSLRTAAGRKKFRERLPGGISDIVRWNKEQTGIGELNIPANEPFGELGAEMGYLEYKSRGLYSSLTTFLTPEYMAKLPMMGVEEKMSIMISNPELATELGIDAQMGPEGAAKTGYGFTPSHVAGWRQIGEVARSELQRKSFGGPVRPADAIDLTPELKSELEAALSLMDPKRPDFAALEDVITARYGPGSQVLWNADVGRAFPRPSAIESTATSDFPGGTPYYDPLSILTKNYAPALSQFLKASTSFAEQGIKGFRPSGQLKSFYTEIGSIFSSASRGVEKLLQASFMGGAVGGRYNFQSAAGFNTVVMQTDAMNAVLRNLGQTANLSGAEMGEYMSIAQEQLRRAGRIPGLAVRQPLLGKPEGVLPVWATTTGIMRSLGINYPEGTVVSRGKVTPGSIFSTGIAFSAGPLMAKVVGDWDLDYGKVTIAARANPNLGLMVSQNEALQRMLGMPTGRQVAEMKENLTTAMGYKGLVAGGEMNVLAEAFSGIISKGQAPSPGADPFTPVLLGVPRAEMWEQGIKTTGAVGGMGIEYNTRRKLEASASALGWSGESVALGHTASGLRYQEYLDKLRGTLRNVTSLLGSVSFEPNPITGAARLIAKMGPEGAWPTLWEAGPQDPKHPMMGQMVDYLALALQRDVSEMRQSVTGDFASFAMAQSEADIPLIKEAIGQTGDIRAALSTVYKDREYDPTRTPLGLGLLSSALERAEGWGDKPARQAKDPATLQPRTTMDIAAIRAASFQFMGERTQVGQLSQKPVIQALKAGYGYLTRKWPPTMGEIGNLHGMALDLQKKDRPVPVLWQQMLGRYDAVRESQAVVDTAISQSVRPTATFIEPDRYTSPPIEKRITYNQPGMLPFVIDWKGKNYLLGGSDVDLPGGFKTVHEGELIVPTHIGESVYPKNITAAIQAGALGVVDRPGMLGGVRQNLPRSVPLENAPFLKSVFDASALGAAGAVSEASINMSRSYPSRMTQSALTTAAQSFAARRTLLATAPRYEGLIEDVYKLLPEGEVTVEGKTGPGRGRYLGSKWGMRDPTEMLMDVTSENLPGLQRLYETDPGKFKTLSKEFTKAMSFQQVQQQKDVLTTYSDAELTAQRGFLESPTDPKSKVALWQAKIGAITQGLAGAEGWGGGGGGGTGGRLGRLVSEVPTESLKDFAKEVDNAAVKLKDLSGIIETEGETSIAGVKAARKMRRIEGGMQMREAGMLLPAAVERYQGLMAAAEAEDTPEARRAAVQAAQDVRGLSRQYGAGQAAVTKGKVGPSAMGSRFMRGLIGGWGLMYLGHLAQFPMGQAGFGFAEAEQFQGQMAAYGGGQLGPEVQPFPSIQTRTYEAQLLYGGQGLGAIQAAQAGMAPLTRDIAGAGLAAAAGGAGALYVSSIAAGVPGLEGLAAGAQAWAGPVAGLTALAYGALQVSAWRQQPQQTLAAAVAGNIAEGAPALDRRFGQPWGEGVTAQGVMGAMGATLREQWGMTPDQRERSRQLTSIMGGWAAGEQPFISGGAPPGASLLSLIPPEEMPVAAQIFAAGKLPGQREGLDPNLRGQAFLRLGKYATLPQMEDVVWAQMRGIDTPALASSLLQASRQKVTQAAASALELQITAEVTDIYQAGELGMGASIMASTPMSMLNRMYGEGFDEKATGFDLAPWARSDYAKLFLQEGALEQAANVQGLVRTGDSLNLLAKLKSGKATRQDIRALATSQARETRAQAVSEQIAFYAPEYAQGAFTSAQLSPQQGELWQSAAAGIAQASKLGISEGRWLGQMTQAGQGGVTQNLLGQQALGMTQQYAMWGGQQTSQFFGWAGASLGNQVMGQRLMRQDPLGFADLAMGYGGAAPYAPAAQFATTVDVGPGGQLTGLGWGTTSLARAGGPTAEGMANQMWGDQWKGTRWGEAAVSGTTTPFGKKVFGQRAMQWDMRALQYEAQQASFGAAYAQIALQEEYMPKFWDVQDRQRALGHEQALWGFEQQKQQFRMQGTQFQEQMGLQQRGQQMQRGWAVQDWAYQDKTRAMQWGWKQEDFEEQVRFMTGRQRKLAERGMERETIMYGMEGERIDVQRQRQKESWALEDARFDMQKKHFQEQRELQETNMKKQREFYDEGKKLQDEAIKLQREYQMRQLELQKAAIGAQASYAEQMKVAQDAMIALGEEQEDNSGRWKLAQSRQVEMINTIVNGMNWLIDHMPEAFESMLSGKGHMGHYTPKTGTSTGGTYSAEATGGPMLPGQLTIVGEGGIEVLRSSIPQHVFPTNETFAAMLGGTNTLSDPWAQTVVEAGGSSTGGSQRPTTIIVNIGNERLGEFVLNTVNDALEVR